MEGNCIRNPIPTYHCLMLCTCCRSKRVLVTSSIVNSILNSKSGAMIISTSRCCFYELLFSCISIVYYAADCVYFLSVD